MISQAPPKTAIPRKSLYRFSLYARCLDRLIENKVATVSSHTLAAAAGVKPAQLRRDLMYLGSHGRRGLGYNVNRLREQIQRTMGTKRLVPVVLIGAGNLGTALASYDGFAKEGFEVVSAFDIKPGTDHHTDLPVPLRPMSEMAAFVRREGIRIAILTVPAAAAQAATDDLIAAGIQAILNFAPIILQVPDHVTANNVNLAIELESLAYFIRS